MRSEHCTVFMSCSFVHCLRGSMANKWALDQAEPPAVLGTETFSLVTLLNVM